MKRKLVKSVRFESGTLYATVEGRHLPLAECRPKLEIYEDSTTISTLGAGYQVKTHSVRLVICDDIQGTRDITSDYLRNVSRFELSAEIQCEDSIFRDIIFDSITPVEIDLDGAWIFEAQVLPDMMKNVLGL